MPDPCLDAAGSLNNPDTTPEPPVITPIDPVCVGEWELGGDDLCAQNEKINQAGYAAENLNINGAPLRIYKLLGVHEQGEGVITSQGDLFASSPAPGYPLSGLVAATGVWRSLQTGTGVAGVAYIGCDFGFNMVDSTTVSEYGPSKPNWKNVGAISIKQGNTAFSFARQLRVDITDGAVTMGAPLTGPSSAIAAVAGPNAEEGLVQIFFDSATAFTATFSGNVVGTVALGTGVVGTQLNHPIVSFTVTGTYSTGNSLAFPINYVWKRAGVFNVMQSASAITLNLQKTLLAKAVRVMPSLGTISANWEVGEFNVLDSPPTNINNIQDLFFNENRDRDYAKEPITIKAQYSISDSVTDLSKYGLNILDSYSFVVSFPQIVAALGRPLVTGDIFELVPEMQYDHNMKPVRKYLEVVDTGWAASGFSAGWSPSLMRFTANQALPSQETRDLFGTIDTQKYIVADEFFNDLGVQIDTTPLTNTEEIKKEAAKAVPELGDDIEMAVQGTPMPKIQPPPNAKGNPAPVVPGNAKLSPKIEDGLPPGGAPYAEGYTLPDTSTLDASNDGDWFRLYYAPSTNLAPRLWRFSIVKNKWVYMETDRRKAGSSLKPSVQSILNSDTKQGLKKKLS